VRIAFLQFDAREADRAGNIARVAAAAAEARREGAALLALPELFASGYDLAAARAESGWEREIAAAAALSRERSLAIVGSLLEPAPAASGSPLPANCAIAWERGVERSRYRKAHRFAPLGECEHVRAGEALPVPFELAGLRIALAICYDLRFPELFRPAAVAGVDLFIVPAQWPAVRIGQWRALLVARAIENQCFVLGVNRAGRFRDTLFGGNSMLVSPEGEIRVDAGTEEGLSFGEIDPAEARDWRARFPALRDRRTDLYR
jgi:predicted amidohydrolase